MSNSPPSSSSSGKGLSIPRKLALNAINEIQNRSNDYLLSKRGGKGLEEGRKRAALAAVISTVSSVGADRLTKADFDELRDLSEQESHDKVHFMDKLTNKLLDAIPRRSDESMDELRKRLEDRHRVEQPGLSIKRISRNFKTLSSKMDLVFSLQYSIIHVISWDKPSLTLTFLILYTWGCLMPYLFLVYPVFYVLTGVLIPNYLYRHPLAKPDIIPTRARGDSSIFGFLRTENAWELDRQRILLERSRTLERILSQELELSTISSRTSTDSEDEGSSSLFYEVFTADSKSNLVFKAVLEEDEETTEKGRTGVVDKVKLLINMRDLQNLTSDIIKMMTRMQDSIYENYSFKDEKRSTKHFFNLIALILITIVLGPYIPWRAIFIITVWVLILLKHPNRQHILKQLKPATKHKLPPKHRTEVKRRASRLGELIVDDPPQYRTIQIYQIEKQDLIKPSVYELYMYSSSIFNESDTLRIQKKRPKGTTNLSLVQAPSSSWKFTEKNWTVDADPGSWCLENGVLDEMEIDGEWAYDKSGEYRRCRLVREVVRYSRPPKKR